ncbi:hypothetical protein ACLESO_41580, partial [Pyxidicoccus sp. 3LG]
EAGGNGTPERHRATHLPMTDLNRMLWRCVVASVFLGVAACGGADVEVLEENSLGTAESRLACTVNRDCAGGTPVNCSSADGACNSGPDNGGWVQCDANARIYCQQPPPACTCGATQYTLVRRANGSTCGAAYQLANSWADEDIASACPSGGCNITRSLMSCSPLGPGRDQGFSMGVSVTYSCNEPVGCQ